MTPYQEIPARIELEEMDKPCEKCHVVNESVELRQCDELICELCWEEMSKIKHTEVNHNTAATSSEMNPKAESFSPQSEVEGEILFHEAKSKTSILFTVLVIMKQMKATGKIKLVTALQLRIRHLPQRNAEM